MEDIYFRDIIDNYKYIKSLKIIEDNELNQLLFGEYLSCDEDIIEIIKNSVKDDDMLPNYVSLINIQSTEENKIKIRDKFIYLIISNYVGNYEKDDKKLLLLDNNKLKCMELFDEENNYEDYNLIYPHYNNLLKNRKYKDYFIGISNKLFKLLNSINSTYYEKITNLDDSTISFIESLNTIKEWEKLDRIERKQQLVNEIIARILYASVDFVSSYFENVISKEEYIKTDDFYKTLKDLRLNNQLLENAKLINKNNKLVINKVIELYPYSVELFINETKDNNYIELAKKFGYKFSENIINCSYYIYNDVNLELIPIRERENYLSKLIKLFREYKSNNNINILYKLFIGVDTYIRNVNYYDPDIKLFNHESYEIFNKDNYNNDKSIEYIKKLTNKYKESTLNMTLGRLVLESFPTSTLDIKINYFNYLVELKEMYIYLIEKFSLNINKLNNSLNKNSHLYKMINNYYYDNELMIKEDKIINSPELDEILNNLKFMTTVDASDDFIKEKFLNDSSNILTILKSICDTDEITKYYLNIYCLEYILMGLVENV